MARALVTRLCCALGAFAGVVLAGSLGSASPQATDSAARGEASLSAVEASGATPQGEASQDTPLSNVQKDALVAPAAPDAAFVRVRGSSLWLGDAPFRFVGANASVMHGPREREYYEAVLDAIAEDGLKVIRIWALGEVPAPGLPHHPLYAFRIGRDGWVEASFDHLDRVLAAARERGLRAIVVLANRWKDYGGIATYLTWAGQPVERNEAGEPSAKSLGAFYRCEACQAMYREHVERIVGRVNRVTQVAYRDDPTIMAWELINEASAVSARDEDAMLRWVAESARFVRSLDPNHLISAGHIGYRTARERQVWRKVQALPEVDFADAHTYPRGDARITDTARLSRWIEDPLALAWVDLEKPFVFGEFGFNRGKSPAQDVERRRWVGAFLDHAAQRGAAGALVWIYEPPGNPLRTHTISADPTHVPSLRVRRLLRAKASNLFARDATPPLARWKRSPTLQRFDYLQTERDTQRPHRGFVQEQGEQVLDIDPVAFALSRFERTGVHSGHALDTVWGMGEGFVEYRFMAPQGLPEALAIEARISSELPGQGDGNDPRDGSDVEISVDGQSLGIVRAIPDDGLGQRVRVELTDARTLRRIFGTRRVHTLRFAALPSAYAGGLCIYGKPTSNGPGAQEAVPGPHSVRITLRGALGAPARVAQAERTPSAQDASLP